MLLKFSHAVYLPIAACENTSILTFSLAALYTHACYMQAWTMLYWHANMNKVSLGWLG